MNGSSTIAEERAEDRPAKGDRALHRAVRAACAALPCTSLDDPGPWYPARRDALREVVALIEMGASPNHRNSEGQTAFDIASGDPTCLNAMHAAHHRYAQWNVRLSRKMAEDRDAVGNTALHRAVKEGNAQVADDLLRLGARVEQMNRYGITPFYAAVAAGDAEMAKVLIRGSSREGIEAAASQACRNGDTPLHLAAELGRKDILRLLVRPVTDFTLTALDIENADGMTPAAAAEMAGHDGLARWLRRDTRALGRRWGIYAAFGAMLALFALVGLARRQGWPDGWLGI